MMTKLFVYIGYIFLFMIMILLLQKENLGLVLSSSSSGTGSGAAKPPYVQLLFPSNTKLSGDLTFVFVVKFGAITKNARLFDFGDGRSANNIFLGNEGTFAKLTFQVWDGSSQSHGTSMSNQDFQAGIRYHIVAVVDSSGQVCVCVCVCVCVYEREEGEGGREREEL